MSRHGLDRDSRSRQFEKVNLDVMDNLDTLKKLVSTLRMFSTVQKPSLDSLDYSKNRDFSIFVEILIEISIEISISTPKKSQSRPSRKSRQVLKTGLDAKDVLDLDLDWSRRRDPQA